MMGSRALPAYVCAAANLAAVVALVTVLSPGTTLSDDATRAAYVRDHVVVWRVGWALWVLAAISLLLFYAWWRSRIGAGWIALGIAAAGFAADLTAESLLIAIVPDRPDLARTCFFLTGTVANGWHFAGTGDFDGNGKSDILWVNNDGKASIWDNGAISGAHIVAAASTVANGWHFG